MKKSFTMLELIFVIVIIGILSGIAIPRLWVTRDDAVNAKVKTEVSTVRSAISSKYTKLVLAGNSSCPDLEKSTSDDTLFENILTYPISKQEGSLEWDGNGTDYNVTYDNRTIHFNYIDNPDEGCKFECNTTDSTAYDFNCSLFK